MDVLDLAWRIVLDKRMQYIGTAYYDDTKTGWCHDDECTNRQGIGRLKVLYRGKP